MLNYSGTDGLGCGRVFDDAAWTQGRGGEARPPTSPELLPKK